MLYSRYREGLQTRNVLIVGAGRVAHALRNHLESLRHLGFRFKGFIALTEHESESGDADIIGDVRNCLSLARSLFVDEIFFSVPAEKQLVIGMVEEARGLGIDVRVVPDLYDGLAWNAPVEYIGQFSDHTSSPARTASVGVLDEATAGRDHIGVGAAAGLAHHAVADRSHPVGLGRAGLLSFAADRAQGADVHLLQVPHDVRRCGEPEGRPDRHERARRDSVQDCERSPHHAGWALSAQYSLDELPQLYNVLRGDMSLVGPRPPVGSEVEQYDLAHLRRLDVLPGMTGLWQVEARQDPSFDSYISLDTAYVENWSLWLDMKILARTVGVVLSGTGS